MKIYKSLKHNSFISTISLQANNINGIQNQVIPVYVFSGTTPDNAILVNGEPTDLIYNVNINKDVRSIMNMVIVGGNIPISDGDYIYIGSKNSSNQLVPLSEYIRPLPSKATPTSKVYITNHLDKNSYCFFLSEGIFKLGILNSGLLEVFDFDDLDSKLVSINIPNYNPI